MTFIQKFRAWLRRPNKSTIEQYIETFIVVVPIAFIIRTYFYGLYQVPTGSMETTMLVGERFFADKFFVNFYPIERGNIITFNDPNFAYSDVWYKKLFENYVWGPSNWTKRVIGIPGDHVKGVIEDGKPVVYLNGQKLDEPYINKYPLIALYRDSSQPWDFRSYDPSVSYEEQPFYAMDEFSVERAKRLVRNYNDSNIKMPYQPVECYGRTVDEFDVQLGENQYWAMGDNRQGSNDSRYWGPLDGSLIHGVIKWRLISIDSTDSWLIFDLASHPIDFWKRVRWNRFFQRVR
ncbi:MAG TPA: signal peptidase I [Candidatus Babeliales bacterium]|nr:signal peptidase I [Candidatus Babeliales bacterium]